jgi:perosamine synthetase
MRSKHVQQTLAMFGGTPVRTRPFPPYPLIGEEEKRAVLDVLESGRLSTFAASTGPEFLGGRKIRQFEEDFARYHRVPYAIAVNSATAGLHTALAAAGVAPGDEVIVPPYTFTATASSVLMANAIPVFADVDARTYCLDPLKVKEAITERTKAIIPVHLLGHPAEMEALMTIAADHHLVVIEDCAQAPGADYKGCQVGTIGQLGVFSFQETKNMVTGEGGMVLTRDSWLAERCRMIRNHGEAVVEGRSRQYLANMVGWNYRMTELEAAIGVEQLKKLPYLNQERIRLASYLSERLVAFDGLDMPYRAPFVQHVYHVYGMRYNAQQVGLPRQTFVKALRAEGIPLGTGYPHPLYENPLFKERIAYGDKGCPYTCGWYTGNVQYATGMCPVAEDLCARSALWLFVARPPATLDDMEDIVRAFAKVFTNLDALRERE